MPTTRRHSDNGTVTEVVAVAEEEDEEEDEEDNNLLPVLAVTGMSTSIVVANGWLKASAVGVASAVARAGSAARKA